MTSMPAHSVESPELGHWLVVIAAGVMMFALKAVVPVGAGERELPRRAVALTGLVAPAVIGALLSTSGMSVDLVRRLAVLAVATIVAVRSGSFPLTIATGLAAHLALEALT